MKILSAEQIRQWDTYTITHEPIASIELMERASREFTLWVVQRFPPKAHSIYIVCGVGNNGGDGLAVARLLQSFDYDITVIYCLTSHVCSEDNQINRQRLDNTPIIELAENTPFPNVKQNSLLIDALFGAGLNRPIMGYWGDWINYLNQQSCIRIAIDIPSGLFADKSSEGNILKADFTVSFQKPKLAFFFAGNQDFIGEWEVLPIGLSPEFQVETPFYTIDKSVGQILKKRKKHDHKGSFGHGLMVAGSYGKMGAAILATKAVLRSGAGLVSAHIPACGYEIMQTAFPEAMTQIDENERIITRIEINGNHKVVGIGPGIGTSHITAKALEALLQQTNIPMVLDADALNILAQQPDLLANIPAGSVLTPHPKEFERLFGSTKNDFERNYLQRTKAKEWGIYLILKGAYTVVATPQGDCYFNTTGNPGMGTAGMGDVLTGILVGLLAQGYTPLEASLLGVYLHGLAGDLAVEVKSQESLIASDVLAYLGKAFQHLHDSQI
jgi:NAD(P)H-hydrate epimerase